MILVPVWQITTAGAFSIVSPKPTTKAPFILLAAICYVSYGRGPGICGPEVRGSSGRNIVGSCYHLDQSIQSAGWCSPPGCFQKSSTPVRFPSIMASPVPIEAPPCLLSWWCFASLLLHHHLSLSRPFAVLHCG